MIRSYISLLLGACFSNISAQIVGNSSSTFSFRNCFDISFIFIILYYFPSSFVPITRVLSNQKIREKGSPLVCTLKELNFADIAVFGVLHEISFNPRKLEEKHIHKIFDFLNKCSNYTFQIRFKEFSKLRKPRNKVPMELILFSVLRKIGNVALVHLNYVSV